MRRNASILLLMHDVSLRLVASLYVLCVLYRILFRFDFDFYYRMEADESEFSYNS